MKTRPYKVLVIDDQETDRTLLKEIILQYNDMSVVGEACNATEGLQNIKSLKPDLIFLDIRLNGKDGFDLIAELKNENINDFDVVLYSASVDYYKKAIQYHVFDFLNKPIQLEELDAIVERFREKHSQLPVAPVYNRTIHPINPPDKRCMPVREGSQYINPADIVTIEGHNKECDILTFTGDKFTVLLKLKAAIELINYSNIQMARPGFAFNIDYLYSKSPKQKKCTLLYNNIKLEIELSRRQMKKLP
jgi:two-component system, LytTR family, response regulator